MTRKLGMEDRVGLLGYVPDEDIPVLYSSADVFVLPSRSEGFGLVLLEAMACGTPVIGADAGGIPTAIEDDETGLIVRRDVNALADAMRSLRTEPTNWQAMSETSLNQANRNSWDEVTSRVEELYSSLSDRYHK
jgi:phosphatidylinositol alpha-1,6-mannosyltransferase